MKLPGFPFLVLALLCAVPQQASAQSVSEVRAALDSGNPGEARRLFEALAQTQQLDEAAWRGFASQLFRAGAPDDAVAILELAAGRFPSDARFPYLAAFVLSESERCQEAIPFAQQSMYLEETADASWVLAGCEYSLGRPDVAGTEYFRYIALETRTDKADQINIARRRSADAPGAEVTDSGEVVMPETAESGVTLAPPAPVADVPAPEVSFNPGTFASADAARAAGLAAAANARWVEGASAFAAVVEFVPSDADAWYRLGVCEALSGRTLHALTAFEGAIAADPRISVASRRRSQAEARLAHEQSRALDPAGFAWSASARDAAAMAAASEGLWLATHRASWAAEPAGDSVAGSLASVGAGDSEEALVRSLGALGTTPSDPDVWVLAADCARLASELELSDYLLGVAVELGASPDRIERLREDLRMRERHAERLSQQRMK